MDAAPSPAAPEPPSDSEQSRRRRKILLLLFLSIALLAVVGVCGFHLLTKKPVTSVVPVSLPVLPEGPLEPKFVTYMTLDDMAGPRGVSVSPSGRTVYVADPDAATVWVFDREGNPLPPLRGEGEGRLHAPISAAASPQGRIYVVDRLQNRVAMYTEEGEFVGNFRPSNMPTTFRLAPLSVAFDDEGNMYLGDAEGAAYIFDGQGNLKLRLLAPEGNVMGPYGIAVNGSGTVAVTDTNRGRVLVYGSDGSLIRTLEGDFSLPRGVAIDAEGSIFVVDAFAHQVLLYDPEGKLQRAFGTRGALDGQMNFPDDVALDGTGRVYVADRGNHRVQIWSY